MDQRSIVFLPMRVYIAAVIALLTACGSAPLPKNTVVVSTPATLTPNPIEVSTPINVSFSTYSKDWPVDWQWIDPDERNVPTPHDVKSGVLRVSVPAKKRPVRR